MRGLVALVVCLPLSLVACGSSDDDGGDDDDVPGEVDAGDEPGEIDADPGAGDVEPRSGRWSYDEYSETGGDCGELTDQIDPDGEFDLENNGDGTFTITPADGTGPFECELDGSDFGCPERGAGSASQEGIDATVSARAQAEGTFSDEEHATGTQEVTLSCTGSQCGLVEQATGVTLPCTVTADFEVSWEAPL
jgi:hypothetical protein